MRPITVRNLPGPVSRALIARAREKGISLNKAVIELLLEALDERPRERRKVHHDLDFLIGTLTEEDARAVDASLAEQRKIDPELWKK